MEKREMSEDGVKNRFSCQLVATSCYLWMNEFCVYFGCHMKRSWILKPSICQHIVLSKYMSFVWYSRSKLSTMQTTLSLSLLVPRHKFSQQETQSMIEFLYCKTNSRFANVINGFCFRLIFEFFSIVWRGLCAFSSSMRPVSIAFKISTDYIISIPLELNIRLLRKMIRILSVSSTNASTDADGKFRAKMWKLVAVDRLHGNVMCWRINVKIQMVNVFINNFVFYFVRGWYQAISLSSLLYALSNQKEKT